LSAPTCRADASIFSSEFHITPATLFLSFTSTFFAMYLTVHSSTSAYKVISDVSERFEPSLLLSMRTTARVLVVHLTSQFC